MRRPEVGIFALAILAACAIPADAPNWDMVWNIPVPDKGALNIPVSSFLPPGVSFIAGPPAAFGASIASAPSISRPLGTQCPSCPNATAPKPAFTAPLATTTVSLTAAANLTSATLAAGSQVVITMTNGYNFDPINPPGGSPGTITITISNGAANLANPLVLSGGTTTIPGGGATKSFTIPLNGTIVNTSGITVSMTMDSPAGSAAQPVAMSPGQLFTAAVAPTLNISSATVSIAAQAVNAAPAPVDMSGIDTTIAKHIPDSTSTQGTMFVTLSNPFTVGGAMTITFSKDPADLGPAITPITKNLTLTAATNATTPSVRTVAINFSGKELRRMLGRKLQAAFGGTTAAGSLTVTPVQKVSATSRLQLTLFARAE